MCVRLKLLYTVNTFQFEQLHDDCGGGDDDDDGDDDDNDDVVQLLERLFLLAPHGLGSCSM